jgi:hypothetical protein
LGLPAREYLLVCLKRLERVLIWFWDIIDDKTRFLLASYMSVSRNAKDAEMLMRKALDRAEKLPGRVLKNPVLVRNNLSPRYEMGVGFHPFNSFSAPY